MRKGDVTRGAVLDEATALARRVGLGGLTIGVLAAQTEMSKSGLFAHFGSKETLQIEVLDHAAEAFVDDVIRPALAAPRGEPRLRVLFERWIDWEGVPGGCPFVAAAMEFDDRPGPVRDRLAHHQREWLDTLSRVAEGAVREGHFRAGVDTRQFAQDLYGVAIAFQLTHRLLEDPDAERRARRALDSLIATAR
ncbi:TetR/AcrR family transcriptional regulator [Pseudonocardia sp.]|uniref:TetR/AcrR family transcriptional regulator n=1 Tax=Pseudonocardia sp. TaxID=60912 RepID=UPI003D098E5C